MDIHNALCRLHFNWTNSFQIPKGELVICQPWINNYSKYIYVNQIQICFDPGTFILTTRLATHIDRDLCARPGWDIPPGICFIRPLERCLFCRPGDCAYQSGDCIGRTEANDLKLVTHRCRWANAYIETGKFNTQEPPAFISEWLNAKRYFNFVLDKYCGKTELCPGYNMPMRKSAARPLSSVERNFFKMSDAANKIKTYDAQKH